MIKAHITFYAKAFLKYIFETKMLLIFQKRFLVFYKNVDIETNECRFQCSVFKLNCASFTNDVGIKYDAHLLLYNYK